MPIISRSFIENGKRITVITPDSSPIQDLFRSVVRFASVHPSDEFIMEVKNKKFSFHRFVTIEEFNRILKKLTPEEYHALEYKVESLNTSEWNKVEKYHLYELQLDQALFTRDTLWAKEIYDFMSELENNIHVKKFKSTHKTY